MSLKRPAMDERDLGLKIKARREELGLSQNEVAQALGIDQGKMSLVERGQRRLDLLKELPVLAKKLKVSIDWFFEDTSAPKSLSAFDAWLQQHFPDVEFEEFEKKRIAQFLEPVLDSYVKHDPTLSKRVVNR